MYYYYYCYYYIYIYIYYEYCDCYQIYIYIYTCKKHTIKHVPTKKNMNDTIIQFKEKANIYNNPIRRKEIRDDKKHDRSATPGSWSTSPASSPWSPRWRAPCRARSRCLQR